MPSASVTCAEAPASCDGAWLPASAARAGADADTAEPVDYATPAEVECPTSPAGEAQDGTCDALPLDSWYRYRVSRFPDSESGGTTIAPARHARSGPLAASCGAPPPDAGHLAPPAAQPVALFAVPTQIRDSARFSFTPDARVLPARALAPPDRPPRG